MKGEGYVSSEVISEGRGWSWGSGDYPDSGGNIHPLLWGGYKVYGVRICG